MPGASSLLATGTSRPSRLQTGRTGQPTYRTGWRGPRVCVRRVCVCQASVCVCVSSRVCMCVCVCVSLGWAVGYVVNVQGSPVQPALLASSGDFTAYDYDYYGRTNPDCRKGQPYACKVAFRIPGPTGRRDVFWPLLCEHRRS